MQSLTLSTVSKPGEPAGHNLTIMTKRTARTTVWMIGLVPVLAMLAGLGLSDLASPASALNAAGRLAGTAGLALLLLAAALSARVPGFDRPFGGLTKLWRTHHHLGAWSLLLLLAHPLLLALSAGTAGVDAAASTLFPSPGQTEIWAGWAALVLMMVFLAPSFSFFGRPDYAHWKKLHRLAGPAVILALIHTFLLSRTMPAYLDVLIWSTLALLAVGAVAWRFVFSRRVGRLEHRVVNVDSIANNVVELTLQPEHRRLSHEAGNFVYLTVYDRDLEAGYGEEHPYTISSSPKEPALRLAIKDLGDASRAIQNISEGSRATVEGPYGRFFPHPNEVVAPELWVAGGIGITPFLARMRHLERIGQPADVCLIFCVQDETRELFRDELRSLATSLPGFNLEFHHFYREGPVSREYVEKVCPDLAQRLVHICGPRPLNDLLIQHARSAGIPASSIHTEEFELL